MSEKVFLRGVLLHYFNMKKNAAESHLLLVEVYGEHALAKLEAVLHVRNAAGTPQKEVIFASDCYWR